MASMTNTQGTTEHELKTRLAPVVSGAVGDAVNSVLLPRLNAQLAAVADRLDRIAEEVGMVNGTANAILSSQDIARRFETVRGELLSRMDAQEASVAAGTEQLLQMLAERISAFEATVEARVVTLEALSFWTLVRLAARRLVGR